jgi:hypothetical protein
MRTYQSKLLLSVVVRQLASSLRGAAAACAAAGFQLTVQVNGLGSQQRSQHVSNTSLDIHVDNGDQEDPGREYRQRDSWRGEYLAALVTAS